MFWKKKSDKPKSLINSAPEVRGTFRVSPDPKDPVEFMLFGKKVSILDISIGGVSFYNDHFAEGKREKVKFFLPGDPTEILTTPEIVRIIEEKNICCAQFIILSNSSDVF